MERVPTHAEPLDSDAHLRRELELLELRLWREILLVRAERGPGARYDEFAGLIVSDEEIDRYLQSSDREDPSEHPDTTLLDLQIAALAASLASDTRRTLAEGRYLRLEHVREAFALDGDEYQTVLACLAPDLDLKFERYFAYLQNDVSKKRPSLQLLGKLFFAESTKTSTLRRLVAADDSLVGVHLLDLLRAPGASLASGEFRAADGVVNFLLGSDAPDPELRCIGSWRNKRALPAGPRYFEQHRRHVTQLLGFAERDGRLPYTYVRAPEGCGKEDLVLAVAWGLDASVLECGIEELLACPGDFADWFKVMHRDLRLETGFLWVRWADTPRAGEGERARLRLFGRLLRLHPAVNLVVTGQKGARELAELLGLELLELDLPPPSATERLELWRHAAGDEIGSDEPLLFESLATKFKFGPGRIASTMQRLSWTRPCAGHDESTEQAFHRACRAESNAALETYALKLHARYTWKDLVLPAGVLEQLREIVNAVRYRARVHGEWGFEGKFSLGKGLNVLFSGPSGTGKTMSAEVLATDLALDVYKIDLSSVVSKYIGETEKNLSRIFREADSANCILLFDEADALFGKRSEVKDSHDRYANIEINYLLQRMEEYEGIVILTTNMLKNLDSAFTRRLQHTVEFPAPDERQRSLLWSKVFPETTPLAEDLNLEFLAKRFKFSGASIKNIALHSAFLAASNGGVVDMGHVVNAISREYKKLGKLASRSEFGAYYHLVHEHAEPSDSTVER